METWKFFDITHKNHIICNPSSLEKYQQLIDLPAPADRSQRPGNRHGQR